MRWVAILPFFFCCSFAFSLPQEPVVVAGEARFMQESQSLQIMTGNKAIIDWNSFSIGAQEMARFVQPSVNSAVLNRVTGTEMSQILGQLQANGKIYLINSSGILIGPDAMINTAAFFSSTLPLSNEAFLEGKDLIFSGDSSASIIHLGTIKATAGDVAIFAHKVENHGHIEAKEGTVSLTAGHEILLKPSGETLLHIRPDLRALGVDNSGSIEALKAIVQAEGSYALGINQQGNITLSQEGGKIYIRGENTSLQIARGAVLKAPEGEIEIDIHTDCIPLYQFGTLDVSGESGGTITLKAPRCLQEGILLADGRSGPGGTISIETNGPYIECERARLSASGTTGGTICVNTGTGSFFTSGTYEALGDTGGSVHLLGDHLKLVAAKIDASGEKQGGEVLIGGDLRGENPNIPNASNSYLSGYTKVRAEGDEGGKVIVWSNQKTEHFGEISACGKARGGFVEISGKECHVEGKATASGPGGSLLFDPLNIVITVPNQPAYPQYQFIHSSQGSPPGFGVGTNILPLPSGNVVVADPSDDFVGFANSGAVYLYNGKTAGIISLLTGSSTNDAVGKNVIALSNGNFVTYTATWSASHTITSVGAATWGSGTSGINGVVSSSNSFVGTTMNDAVSLNGVTNGVIALSNGNYVVSSQNWNSNLGAATWGNGSIGSSGPVGSNNSFVGSSPGDHVSSGGITALINPNDLTLGNYVVSSPSWSGNLGAATWGSGSGGGVGGLSSGNSLVGSNPGDQVGLGGEAQVGAIALTNGNYVVISPEWSSATGAVTWGSGTSGITGTISSGNSFVGTSGGDRIGSVAVTPLTNGNYVIASPNWSSGSGAATWGNGSGGGFGDVGSGNSLIGAANDNVGNNPAIALANGNYAVVSYNWNVPAGATQVGAVTWGNGGTGTFGTVTSANSIIGSTSGDKVGFGSVTALVDPTHGSYVIASPNWHGGSTALGATTWASGTGTTSKIVNSDVSNVTGNSFVGSNTNDQVGLGGVTPLSNGNYVVASSQWTSGTGAATWGNGTNGQFSGGNFGTVGPGNSFVGSSTSDNVSSGRITALFTNGNYVVASPNWNSGVGAASWGNGTNGQFSSVGGGGFGTVSTSNSFTGNLNSLVSSGGITALANGNYVVSSPSFSSGDTVNAAATWGNGTNGTDIDGVITTVGSTFNSITGSLPESSLPIADDTVNGTFIVPFVADGLVKVGLFELSQLDLDNITRAEGQTIRIVPDIVISTLKAGTDVTLAAINDITLDVGSDIFINTPSDPCGGLALAAGGSIDIESPITITAASCGAFSLSALAGHIDIAPSCDINITSTTGDIGAFTLSAGGEIQIESDITVDSAGTLGDVAFSALLGSLTTQGSITCSAETGSISTFSMSAGVDLSIEDTIRLSNTDGSFGKISFNALRDMGINGGGVTLTCNIGSIGDVAFNAGRDLQIFNNNPIAITTANPDGDLSFIAGDDITIGTLSAITGGTGEEVVLRAGRSVITSSDITTENEGLALLANDPLSGTTRLDGPGKITVGPSVALDAGTGDLFLHVLKGTTESGDIKLSADANLSGGAITLLADRQNIFLQGGNTILASSGALMFEAGKDIGVSGSGIKVNGTSGTTFESGREIVIASSITGQGADLLFLAGLDLIGLGTPTITPGTSGTLTLVVDNDFPHKVGPGIFFIPNTTLTTHTGEGLGLFASHKSGNSFPSSINGTPYVPGSKVNEQYGVFYTPGATGAYHFTVFYKQLFNPANHPLVPIGLRNFDVANAEALQRWNHSDLIIGGFLYYDPYPPADTPKALNLTIPSLVEFEKETQDSL